MIPLNRHYDDIIHLSRPVSSRRTPMPASARAAQFAPFAALTGFEDSLDETARLTERSHERPEDDLALLNEQLRTLMESTPGQPVVTLTCLKPDEEKPGGAYHSVTGTVRRISELGQDIPFERIHDIEQASPAC